MEVKNLLFVSFEYFCSICDLNHLGGVGAAEEKGDFCHKNRVVGRSEITKSPITPLILCDRGHTKRGAGTVNN